MVNFYSRLLVFLKIGLRSRSRYCLFFFVTAMHTKGCFDLYSAALTINARLVEFICPTIKLIVVKEFL